MYNPTSSLNSPVTGDYSPPAWNDDILAETCPELFPELSLVSPLSGTGAYQQYDVVAEDSLQHPSTASTLEAGDSVASSRPLSEYSCTPHPHDSGSSAAPSSQAPSSQAPSSQAPSSQAPSSQTSVLHNQPDTLTLPPALEAAAVESAFNPASQNIITVKFSDDKERVNINLVTQDGQIAVSCTRITNNSTSKKPSFIYTGLIVCAINSMENKRANSQEIQSWIIENFNFYKKQKDLKRINTIILDKLFTHKIFHRIEDGASKLAVWTTSMDKDDFRIVFMRRSVVGIYKPKCILQSDISEAVTSPEPVQGSLCSATPQGEIKVEFSPSGDFININLVAPNKEVLETFKAVTNNSNSERPQLTISGLITCAICSMRDRRAKFADIRYWIVNNFNYFKETKHEMTMVSRVRSNLTASESFEKPKGYHSGGAYWNITNDSEAFKKFIMCKVPTNEYRKPKSIDKKSV